MESSCKIKPELSLRVESGTEATFRTLKTIHAMDSMESRQPNEWTDRRNIVTDVNSGY